MAQPTKIHEVKEPGPRFHYIVEWAEHRGLSQADIGIATGADKSVVWRWFKGSVPEKKDYLLALAGLFSGEEYEPDPTIIFRHPDDDWMFRLLRGRSKEEIGRIRATIETAFPRKDAA